MLIKFSKTLSTILRHDTKNFKDVWIRDVDKSKWPSGIIWPIDDVCHYMGRLLHFTRHYDSSEFRDVVLACMPDCPIHPTVTWRDWEACCIPQDFAFKWLAICAFEKPRIAKLCSTKYERSGPDSKVGRSVVDKVIGITAIQGHTYGESANNFQLLGWTKVDQAFTGTHIFFGFYQTTESKAWKILGSEGIFPCGPSHCSTGDRGVRDMVYC